MMPGVTINLVSNLAMNPFFAAAGALVKIMTPGHIVGTWIAAILTICIFSFLYEDNPLYKFAEHLFVGVSAGYIIATTYRNVILPNLFGNIKTGVLSVFQAINQGGIVNWKALSFILAGVMGLMLLMKLLPRINWIARWPLSFMVGIASGLGIVLTMEALILKQIDATVVKLAIFTSANQIDWSQTIQNWLIVIGVCSGLIYFYFSKEHKGFFFGTISRVGIFTLMIAFGAAFGYTVMARVSLLIGRMLFFRDIWWPAVQNTPKVIFNFSESGISPLFILIIMFAALIWGIYRWITQKPVEGH